MGKKLNLGCNHHFLLEIRLSLCASMDAFRLLLADLSVFLKSISHPAYFGGAPPPQGGMTFQILIFYGRPPANEKVLISVFSVPPW